MTSMGRNYNIEPPVAVSVSTSYPTTTVQAELAVDIEFSNSLESWEKRRALTEKKISALRTELDLYTRDLHLLDIAIEGLRKALGGAPKMPEDAGDAHY